MSQIDPMSTFSSSSTGPTNLSQNIKVMKKETDEPSSSQQQNRDSSQESAEDSQQHSSGGGGSGSGHHIHQNILVIFNLYIIVRNC